MTTFGEGLSPLVPKNIDSTSGTKFNDCIDYVGALLGLPSSRIYFTNVTANGANGTGLGNIIPRLNQLQNKSDELEYVFVTINSSKGSSLKQAVHDSSQPYSAPFHKNRVFGNPKIPHVRAVIYLTKESSNWEIARIVAVDDESVPTDWYSSDPTITKIDILGSRQVSEADQLPFVTDEWLEANLFDRELADQIVNQLNSGKRQLILQGPPGTGKTYFAKSFAEEVVGSECFDIVQFHPSYSYEDFVEGYRPVVGVDGVMKFEIRPGALKRIAERAHESPEKNFILVIDEINRGNLSKIFGELLFLLEYREEAVALQYSASDGDLFSLPQNLFIIGTMNTSDRSIAVVDSALRRRFWFVSFHPDLEPTKSLLSRWALKNGVSQEIVWIWNELNSRIEDYNYKLGPSYLMRKDIETSIQVVWELSILPLIEEFYWNSPEEIKSKFGYLEIASSVMGQTQDNEIEVSLSSGSQLEPDSE